MLYLKIFNTPKTGGREHDGQRKQKMNTNKQKSWQCQIGLSERVGRFLAAHQHSYTVPFTLVYAGKYGSAEWEASVYKPQSQQANYTSNCITETENRSKFVAAELENFLYAVTVMDNFLLLRDFLVSSLWKRHNAG